MTQRGVLRTIFAAAFAAVLLTGCAGPYAGDETAKGAGVEELAAAAPTAAPSTESAAPVEEAPTEAPPVVETKTVKETQRVPFTTRTVRDSSLSEGTKRVRTEGVDGVRTLTYELTLTDGVETGRKLVSSVVTKKPVTQVVVVGTKKKSTSRCDPNYSGCVPIASDVDCAGGSGNGPAYVQGPVRVIGDDIYDLDRDGDGLACD